MYIFICAASLKTGAKEEETEKEEKEEEKEKA